VENRTENFCRDQEVDPYLTACWLVLSFLYRTRDSEKLLGRSNSLVTPLGVD